MESLALVVPRKKAEQIRKKLIENGALRTDLRVASDAKRVYFPVRKHMDFGFEIIIRSFRELKQIPTDYRDLLDLPNELQLLLPSSIDVIGHVAIVKLPEELLKYGGKIGRAIAKINKPVKTVCLDSGVKGEKRRRDLKVLFGSKDTLTTYREHGLTFRVDPRTMFFTPRLATERKIVTDQVNESERILDMFAGVGPFSILIAKIRHPERVYACDINREAYELLLENIRLNRVEEKVTPLFGDVRDLCTEVPPVHRVIMNLPHSAFNFLDIAAQKLMENGIIHYYEIMSEENLEGRSEEIIEQLISLGRQHESIDTRIVKSYSPTLRYYAMDISIR